jgi:Holliday junction resolvase RusA-like endonuclease
MNKKQISINVRGIKPAPWANKEWDWRKAIAVEAKKQSQGVPVLRTEFEVSIIFYLLQSTFDKSDLDNLAKPVLDTLFLPNNPQVKDRTLTGALIELDDSQVNKLSLEKRLVSSRQDEGAEINVYWEG